MVIKRTNTHLQVSLVRPLQDVARDTELVGALGRRGGRDVVDILYRFNMRSASGRPVTHTWRHVGVIVVSHEAGGVARFLIAVNAGGAARGRVKLVVGWKKSM